MITDRYTKVILTFIAIGLFLNASIQLFPIAHAYGNGMYVRVTNFETDKQAGEILSVYCKNCKA